MLYIKSIVIIIAVNFVKAKHEKISTDSGEETINTEPHHTSPTSKVRQLTDEILAPAKRSLYPSDDYRTASIEYAEADSEYTRRFEDIEDEGDTNTYLAEKITEFNTDNEEGTVKPHENLSAEKDVLNTETIKQKIMTHHIMLDTNGRSAAEDAIEDLNVALDDNKRSFYDPRIANHRSCYNSGNKLCSSRIYPLRTGFVNPHFATMQQPQPRFIQPLYTTHHPLQKSSQLPPSIKKSPLFEKKEHNSNFLNSNSYPYQTPLTKVHEPNYQEGNKIDILQKLTDATNSALTANNNPISYKDLNNMYPANHNPGLRRFRRSTDIKTNPLDTNVL